MYAKFHIQKPKEACFFENSFMFFKTKNYENKFDN